MSVGTPTNGVALKYTFRLNILTLVSTDKEAYIPVNAAFSVRVIPILVSLSVPSSLPLSSREKQLYCGVSVNSTSWNTLKVLTPWPKINFRANAIEVSFGRVSS